MMRSRPFHAALAILAGAAIVAVSGCAPTDPSTGDSQVAPTATVQASPAIAAPDTLWCAGAAIPRSIVDSPSTTSTLPPELAPLGSWWLPGFDPGTPWQLIDQTATDAVAIRAIDDSTFMNSYGWADVPSWQYFTASTTIPAAEIPGTNWRLVNGGTCQMRTVEATGAGPIWLDRERPNATDTTSITVLVDVQASCYAGVPMDEIAEQVHLIGLSEGPDAIRVIIGVAENWPESTGDELQACPGIGIPPVPFTIDLADPVGDRLILDASTYPDSVITEPSGPQ